MLQKPPKNETSFLYKPLMPDYRKSKLVSMRKRNDQEGRQVRSIPSGNVAEQNEEHRRAKGRNDAQQTITEIYDTKLFQMLNESAKGLAGSRGHRIAGLSPVLLLQAGPHLWRWRRWRGLRSRRRCGLRSRARRGLWRWHWCGLWGRLRGRAQVDIQLNLQIQKNL